jgi:hypothetical protein
MFVRTFVAVTLFTSLLGAAEPANSDIFSVRSFTDPKTKAKILITGQLLGNGEPRDLLAQSLTPPNQKNDKCAIPLLQATPAATHDRIAKSVGPEHLDADSVFLPPMPACKGWK